MSDKTKYEWKDGDLVEHGREEFTKEELALIAKIKAAAKLERFDAIINNGEKKK